MKTYHTEFRFKNPDHSHLHCTHKYFGELSRHEVDAVCRLITDFLILQNPYLSSNEIFLNEKFFGAEKDIRVLTLSNPVQFMSGLKWQMDLIREDQFFPYMPHVTTLEIFPTGIPARFNRYVLKEKDETSFEEKEIFSVILRNCYV